MPRSNHTIKIEIRGWGDLPPSLLYKFLSSNQREDKALLRLFIGILRHHKVPVKKLEREYISELFLAVDWSFLKEYPLDPLIPSSLGYHFGEAKMRTATALEYQLAEHYYHKYIKDWKLHDLRCMFFTVARPLASKAEYLTTEDKRTRLISQSQVEDLAKTGPKIDNAVLSAAFYYVYGNLMHISNLNKKILTGGSGASDGLGWTSTFMSIAEANIFGNLDSVYNTNIHNIFAFMLKKQVENAEIEKRMKRK